MVDFIFTIRYVVASAVTFISIFLMSPILYRVWFDNLRNSIPQTPYGLGLLETGDVFFDNFRIMAFVIPLIIIAWGFIVSQRQRVEQRFA